MRMPIEEFIKQLKILFESNSPTEKGDDEFNYFTCEDKLSFELQSIAYDYLMTPQGIIQSENAAILQNYGFYVYISDGYKHGMLVGCIGIDDSTKILTFGLIN